MKRYIKSFTYIRSAVSIDNLISQFPSVEESDFDEIIRLDPTFREGSSFGGKYAVWLLNQFSKGNFDRSSYSNLRDALDMFVKRSRAFAYSDLGRYKTVKEFLDDSARVGELPLSDNERQKELQRSVHNAGDKDKKLLAKDGKWELWQPLTYEGSISLAQYGGEKAKWCTAYSGDDRYWKRYSKRGPLYIFINIDDPKEKYQSSPSTGSWFYDFNDNELGENRFLDFLNNHSPFAKALDLHEEGVSKFYLKDAELFEYTSEIKLGGIVLKRESREIESYKSASDIVLPEGLETIPQHAFADSYYLTSIKIPKSVRVVGSGAFRLSRLREVVLPDGVDLGWDVFQGTELDEVTIPSGVKEVPRGCFRDCEYLEKVYLPEGLTTLKEIAFDGCRSLKHIDLPSSLKCIERACFRDCVGLEEIVIPDSVVEIEDYAFYFCENLTVFIHTDKFDDALLDCDIKEIVHDF